MDNIENFDFIREFGLPLSFETYDCFLVWLRSYEGDLTDKVSLSIDNTVYLSPLAAIKANS